MFEHNAKDKIYENEDGTFFIGLVRKKTYATYEEAVDTVCERKVLQEIMGHKTIAITMQVYNHVFRGTRRSRNATNFISISGMIFNPILTQFITQLE